MGRRGMPFVIATALAALSLLVAACNTGAGGSGGGQGANGQIFISGSSTVEPITALVAELFVEENPDVNIAVEGPGTSDGFELFCAGETDIQDASRAIEPEEEEACAAGGVEWVELYVGIDGIAVLTSPSNSAVSCLSFGDLYALLGPESQGFESWADANGLGREVGGSGDYPDAPLAVTAPGEESGTYDSFIEIALGDIIEERKQEEVTRPDYTSSGNDNVIIDGIAGAETSLGWVGYAFFEQNQDVVKAIEVDGGDGCMAPSTDSIASGEYPLSRPLFVYVNLGKAAQNPAVQSFVDLYMGEDGLGLAVSEVGYVNIPDADAEATRSAWEEAKASL